MELAGAQAAHLVAVELRELREHHGMDGHVDAHAQRVGAADDGQEALLGQLLHEQSVARQHARVVHAHAARQQTLERLAERRGEPGSLDGLLDELALLLGCHAEARQSLRGGQRRVLREMHEVQRRLAFAQGQLHRALQRHLHVLVGQRHGTRGVGYHVHVGPGLALEASRDGAHVAQRGAHQQELRFRKRQQRYLPRPAAVGVAVEVELVHGHAAHVGVLALAQRLVRQDLGRAADDGRLGVDVRVARDHTHVLASQHLHEIEELLADQRLDGRRVVRAPPRCQRHELHPQRHQRLSRPRGRS